MFVFLSKLAKGDIFSNCLLTTPEGKTLKATENGKEVIDVETGRPIPNVLALLEVDSQQVCGLQFTEFSQENFGWWSCETSEAGIEDSVFHRGTFKINKPDEWPTDIRLPTDIEVKDPKNTKS